MMMNVYEDSKRGMRLLISSFEVAFVRARHSRRIQNSYKYREERAYGDEYTHQPSFQVTDGRNWSIKRAVENADCRRRA
jgi:hypothetical protein